MKELLLKIKRILVFKKILREFHKVVKRNPIVYINFCKEMVFLIDKYTVNDKDFYIYLRKNVTVYREDDDIMVKYDLDGIL